MPDRLKFNEHVIVGAQPSEAELHAMAEDGIKTVINLRHDGEDMQPMSPEQEGEKVRGCGMAYVNIPVSMKDAGPDLVDRFRQAMADAEAPVFVHCKLGQRAGAMMMMDLAVKENWGGQQTLDEAKKMGFQCGNEKLAGFVKQYIDNHHKK